MQTKTKRQHSSETF